MLDWRRQLSSCSRTHPAPLASSSLANWPALISRPVACLNAAWARLMVSSRVSVMVSEMVGKARSFVIQR